MKRCPECNFDNADGADACTQCGAAVYGVNAVCGVPTYGGSSVGQVLGKRYIIEREIASDSLGTTYLAEDAELDVHVAIRALPVTVADDEQAIDELRQEADRVLALSHPSIIRLLRFHFEQKIKYVVSEYVEGRSLEQYVSAGRSLGFDEMVKIFALIATGLDYAHNQNIVHGDIRPENIILNRDGLAKLADLGITRQIRDLLARISPDIIGGTSVYLAPEQFNRGPSDHKSDIYSLAACIYHCLCSKPPFWRGWQQYEVLKQTATALNNLTDVQNAVLMRAFSKDPRERQNSAGELLAELSGALVSRMLVITKHEEKAKGYRDTIAQAKAQAEQKEQEYSEALATAQEKLHAETNARIEAQEQAGSHAETIAELQERIGAQTRTRAEVGEQVRTLTETIGRLESEIEQKTADYSNKITQAQEQADAYTDTIAQAEQKEQEYCEALAAAQEKLHAETNARIEAQEQAGSHAETIAELQERIGAQTRARAEVGEQVRTLTETVGRLESEIEQKTADYSNKLTQAQEQADAYTETIAQAEQKEQEYCEALAAAQEKLHAETNARIEAQEQAMTLSAGESRPKDQKSNSKVKIAATVFVSAVLVIGGLLGGYKYSEFEKDLAEPQQLWKEAQLLARQQNYAHAILAADATIVRFPDYAREERVEHFKTSWEQAQAAEDIWRQVRQLADGSKYEQAISKTEELLTEYPDTKDAGQAKDYLAVWKDIVSKNKHAADLLDEAEKADSAGEFDRALAAVTSVFEFDPDNVRARALKAKLQARKLTTEFKRQFEQLKAQAIACEAGNQWAKAERLYSVALAIRPEDTEIEDRKTKCLFKLHLSEAETAKANNDLETAIDSYAKALSYRDDPSTQSKLDSARAALQIKRMSEQKRLELEKWLKLARQAEKEGDRAEAARWYLKAAQAGDSQAKHKLGRAYLEGSGVPADYAKAVDWLVKAAEDGNSTAMLNLATMYGMEKDYDKAFQWYSNAAEAGESRAMFSLGLLHHDGIGVTKDYVKAVYWYRKAADAGDGRAMSMLALAYYNGKGVTKDHAEAAQWYVRAAEAGDGEAMYNLGVMYYNGEGVAKDDAKAIDLFTKAASKGDIEAMYKVGLAYSNAVGVARDYTRAVGWFAKAAETGHAEAMFNLGVLYYDGFGVDKDYTKAAQWYRKAADAGSANAMVNIGLMYHDGEGLDKDYAKALEWYRRAASADQSLAMFYLGEAYRQGHGAGIDYEQAAKWYRKAAKAGDSKSMFCLGWAYANNEGVAKDYAQAIGWYKKAAENGESAAMYYLGEMYDDGTGVDKNLEQAVYWYQRAARLGYEQAKKRLVRLGKIW
jgi:TPR repeat protein